MRLTELEGAGTVFGFYGSAESLKLVLEQRNFERTRKTRMAWDLFIA